MKTLRRASLWHRFSCKWSGVVKTREAKTVQLPSPSWKSTEHTISQMKVLSAFSWRCLHGLPSLLLLMKALECRHLCTTKIYPYSEVIVCWRGSKFHGLRTESTSSAWQNKVVPWPHSMFPHLYGLLLQSICRNLKTRKVREWLEELLQTGVSVFNSHHHCSARSLSPGPTEKQGTGFLIWRLIITCFWSQCSFTSSGSQCNYLSFIGWKQVGLDVREAMRKIKSGTLPCLQALD